MIAAGGMDYAARVQQLQREVEAVARMEPYAPLRDPAGGMLSKGLGPLQVQRHRADLLGHSIGGGRESSLGLAYRRDLSLGRDARRESTVPWGRRPLTKSNKRGAMATEKRRENTDGARPGADLYDTPPESDKLCPTTHAQDLPMSEWSNRLKQKKTAAERAAEAEAEANIPVVEVKEVGAAASGGLGLSPVHSPLNLSRAVSWLEEYDLDGLAAAEAQFAGELTRGVF